MFRRSRLLVLLLFFGCTAISCRGPQTKHLIVTEVTHFEIQGNGTALNFPVFARTLEIEEIVRDVKLAEYYYRKLSPVYDFKSFTFVGSASRENLLDRSGPLHSPQMVYRHEDSLAHLELSLVSFDGQAATYVFRITDQRTGQVRDHHVTVPAGKSASVGTLFDREHNRGHLVSVSALSLEITPSLQPPQLAEFLAAKNTPRGEALQERFKSSDQKWMDELFGSGAYELPVSPSASEPEEVPPLVEYDTPPSPVGGMQTIGAKVRYPEAARAEGVEGEVIVEVAIDERGHVGETRILRSARADLDSAAMEALREVTFHPATKDGVPIAIRVAVPIRFRLEKEK
ncbi:energy transducer TonB [bacterium]|nr:energy transducer TonB [bacterium]MBU1985260.1 energy transducer TonB [bacterium]